MLEPTKRVPAKFIRNLYDIVSNDRYSQAIGFSENGMVVELRNVEKFVSEVMPKHFKHQNISSFTRQMNNYCFTYIAPIGLSKQQFYCNESFRRGRSDLLYKIQRRKVGFSKVDSSESGSNSGIYEEEEEQEPLELQQQKMEDHMNEDELCQVIEYLQEQNLNMLKQNQFLQEENFKLLSFLRSHHGSVEQEKVVTNNKKMNLDFNNFQSNDEGMMKKKQRFDPHSNNDGCSSSTFFSLMNEKDNSADQEIAKLNFLD